MLKTSARLLVLLAFSIFSAHAQQTSTLSAITKNFVSVDSPVVALEHVRLIDGTGAAAVPDQTVVIEGGNIREIGKSGVVSVPAGALRMDLTGRTVIPGLVGMHDHLFYPSASGQGNAAGAPRLYGEMGFSFPRLYLAGGVTSLRTTGSLEPYTDLALKKMIDGTNSRSQDAHNRSLSRGRRLVCAAVARIIWTRRCRASGQLLAR